MMVPTEPTELIKIAEPGRFSGQRDIAFIDAWLLPMRCCLGHYHVNPVNWVPTALHFFDEETCQFPPGTMPSSITMFTTPNTSSIVDDPMNLPVAFTTFYYKWCKHKGHDIVECRIKASVTNKFV
ncbi:uncharacterized protein ATC70_005361 [Mucor velutinosus]|uniref:Uncharacterized protein n=1 Tax=Mucor velutinosus TaxID=708070 RepID=A0AAN7HS61_9FUNG|nr:hypothetical protein ATC70_005361 [Mucor velutinosus]